MAVLDEAVWADLIGASYGAAAGAVGWGEVKRLVCQVMRAPFSGIAIGDPRPGGTMFNICEDETVPMPEWRSHNPFLAPARRIWAGSQEPRQAVALGHEVVDDAAYVRSDYYADHGRRLQMRYEVGTTVLADASSVSAFGVYRPEHFGPFGEAERALVLAFRPHLQRALQLRRVLRPSLVADVTGVAVLEALPQAAVLVDAEGRVLHANPAAAALAGSGRGVSFSAGTRHGDGSGGSFVVVADKAADGALRRLIRAVALSGDAGRAVRTGSAETGVLILSVLPVPETLMRPARQVGTATGVALLFLREPTAASPLHETTLMDLFGLTRSEASVACALLGGTSAATVARQRNVAVDTVRTQSRAILRKLGARNLRDAEYILGSIAGG